MPPFIKNVSLAERAYQAALLSNSLVMGARNSIQDANQVALLNFCLPVETFSMMKKKYQDKGYSGEVMYQKIYHDAKEQLIGNACFVAGTLVHTREGLRPIEQIKVGDYVLSKPENGIGEPEYKRVTKTFELENKEVWLVEYEAPGTRTGREFVIATGDHPFWVIRAAGTINGERVKHNNTWLTVRELYDYKAQGSVFLKPLSGEIESLCFTIQPMLMASKENEGIVCNDRLIYKETGWVVDLSATPKYKYVNNAHGYIESWFPESDFHLDILLDDESWPDDLAELVGAGSITHISGGFKPLLRTVYNLEVEDFHTYMVGEVGIWVHNSEGCGEKVERIVKTKTTPIRSPVNQSIKGHPLSFCS